MEKAREKFIFTKTKTELVTVPKHKFFIIKGKGNPNNNEEFSEKIGALYSLSYAVRMMPKNGYTPEGYFEYTVYPLEGVWSLTEEGQKQESLNKDELIYSIMIRQPDFVNDEVAERAFEVVRKKKHNPYLDEVVFDSMEDGLCLQMLHIGSYDDEHKTFKIMKEFEESNNLNRISMKHREIYISDFRRVEKDKLKTVLRYKVEKI